MNGNNRRKQILRILSDSSDPVSGANLAKQLGVSRQVIVQDIALLRANGSDILATNAGYVLQQIQSFSRVVKVIHSDEATEKELQIIIDLGGYVEDVFVYHKAYGVVRAELGIKSRKDISVYMDNIQSGKSTALMHVTSGYHYHTIRAESEEILDQIFNTLHQHGFLAALQDYEPINFWETEHNS